MHKSTTITSLKYLGHSLHPANKGLDQTDHLKGLQTPSSKNSQQETPPNSKHSPVFEEYNLASQGPPKKKQKEQLNKKHATLQKKPRDLCRSGYSFKTLDSVLSESRQDKKLACVGDFQRRQTHRREIHAFDCSILPSPASTKPKETCANELQPLRKLFPQKTLETVTASPASCLKKQSSLMVSTRPAQSSNPCTLNTPSSKKIKPKRPIKSLRPSQPAEANASESPADTSPIAAEHARLPMGSPQATGAGGPLNSKPKSEDRLPSFSHDSEGEPAGEAPSSKVSDSHTTGVSPPCHQQNRSSVSWNNFDAFVRGIEALASQSPDSREQAFRMQVAPVPPGSRMSDGCLPGLPELRGPVDFFQ